MSFFVGIDLGTTNSAICSYDGEALRLYKSPEQNDVTPSAIFIDRRGNKYVGARAYNNAPRNPDNAATLFKRLMGTTTPIKLSAVDKVMTPEECSAEILRTLFGYLPEEMRNSAETGNGHYGARRLQPDAEGLPRPPRPRWPVWARSR